MHIENINQIEKNAISHFIQTRNKYSDQFWQSDVKCTRFINLFSCIVFSFKLKKFNRFIKSEFVIYDKENERMHYMHFEEIIFAHNRAIVIALLYEKYTKDIVKLFGKISRWFVNYSGKDKDGWNTSGTMYWRSREDNTYFYLYDESDEIIKKYPKDVSKYPKQKLTRLEKLGIKFFSCISPNFREDIKLLRMDF
jgi:hypothetical protein